MYGRWMRCLGPALLLSAGALFAADADSCASCHPKEVEGYAKTGMAKSIRRPAEVIQASFNHRRSGSKFTVRGNGNGMTQRIERGGLSAEYAVDFIIGSGNAAWGALVTVGDHVFQSPMTYYSKRGVWDMAPGMEGYRHPDFSRPANHECLWCHSGQPLPRPGTINQYRRPIFQAAAISCDRCHGPAEQHLQEPSSKTIVNPAKLAPARRDSVCEQCHLGGEARILNPGRSFSDFRPGMRLEEVFSVYVQAANPPRESPFKVVSHSEQLALSRCAQQTGSEMWCGTCHNPHAKPAEPAGYYRSKCLGCHQDSLEEGHGEPSRDCVSCHMARRQSRDSGHSAFTDHLIARRPAAETKRDSGQPGRLRAWREIRGPLARRNHGLASVLIGERSQSSIHLQRAYRLLSSVQDQYPDDPDVLNGLGMSLALQGKSRPALELFQKAAGANPATPCSTPRSRRPGGKTIHRKRRPQASKGPLRQTRFSNPLTTCWRRFIRTLGKPSRNWKPGGVS